MYGEEVERLRASFSSGRTKELAWRKDQLWRFLAMLRENKKLLCDAVYKDLHKHPGETELMELAGIQNEIVGMLGSLDTLAKPEKVSKSLLAMLNTVYVRKEPFGVCLIMGAWNYPLLLALQPMVGAIAAGNCVLLKPSEVSSATAEVVKNLVHKYLDNDCIKVIVAGPKESGCLINDNKFDFIMYTGSESIGKLVMQAAAKHLTPVILELGGKSPCFVDKSCDLASVSGCITWGKWTNAGQICVAPDYVICESGIKDKLIGHLKARIEEFYGEDPRESSSYGRVINERHIKRLENLLEGADVVHGGVIDEEDLYFSPTIVTNIKEDAPIRANEIFGPILPIFEVESVDDAIELMNKNKNSLQLSIFSQDRRVIDRIVAKTSSGGVTVNEVMMQHNELDLPFGGVGSSGMGTYHGKHSFNAFTQKRGYYEGNTPEIINKIKYPPYTSGQLSFLRKVIYHMIPLKGPLKHLLTLTLLAVIGGLMSYIYTLIM